MDDIVAIPMDKDAVDIVKAILEQNRIILETNRMVLEHLARPMVIVKNK